MRIVKKEEGRIPFAYMFAIVFVLMLLLAGIYSNILGRHDVISINKFYEESDQDLRNINDMVREKAYHVLMEAIHNITKQRDPKLYMIQEYLQKNMAKFIKATFPIVTQNYIVKVDNYTVKVVMDYKKTRAFIKNFKLKWIDFTYGLDNAKEGYLDNNSQLPVYPYVVGFFNYTFKDRRSGFVMKRSMVFNRIVYSPLPLLKFEFDEFRTSTSNTGDFGRLVRYILTTIVEYRILKGYAAGGYGGLSVPVTDVLTKADVEHAVNLALLLESVRFFHTYDQNMANKMGISGILDKYMKKGTIDAADLYYLWKGFDSTRINFFSIARIIGQSIYSYADKFVLELFKIFWGNSLSKYFADPTLKEPLLNWSAIKKRGDGWISEMVTKFLDKWRQWLLIPKTIFLHFAKTSISQKFTIIIILPHFPYIKVERRTVTLNWYVINKPVMNTVDLIKGGNDLKYFELYALGTSSDPPFIHLGHYKYKLVKQTLYEEHANYVGSGGKGSQGYDTLQYIMDALTRSMKDKSNKWDNTTGKGFMDYASYETSLVSMMYGNGASLGTPNPKDNKTILIDGTQKMIQPLQKATNTFKGLIWLRKETWWMYGAYKDYDNKSQALAYLFYLSRDVVDLWYQAMKNLYDGGDPTSSDDKAGPYASDSNHFPDSNQVSTWPTPYSGYPFYGHGNHNGSFNFHRDLVRDAYNDLRLLMWEEALLEGLRNGGFGFPVYSHHKVWDHVKEKTKDAREKVVGKDGLIKNLNFMMFMPYVNKAYYIFKKFSTLRTFLDYITGKGSYKTWSKSSGYGGIGGGDLSNFYKFVRGKVGFPILGFAGVPPTDKSVNNTHPGGNNTTSNVTGLGLDVSHYQGTIDWEKVHSAGYGFVFVKASQGTSYVDPMFATNVRNAYAAGMKVGAYHFATPSDSATSEAEHFINTIKPYMSYLTLPPALDLEQTGGRSWSSLSTWANEFLQDVQSQLGVTPVIYVNVNYARHLDSSVTQWPLWIADWTYDPNATPRTGRWSTWDFWQYSDRGSVPGISSSSVDLDKASGRAGFTSALYNPFLSLSLNGLLGKVPHWLSESFNVLYKNIVLNARYSSIPIFPSMYSGNRVFWDTTLSTDSRLHRTVSESTVVEFQPDYLSSGSNLQISLSLGPGHRFVDVQDPNYDMGNAPFEYQYTVSIHGSINVNLRTERTSLVYSGIHWLTWYNGSVPINLELKIPVYSAWYLESKWHAVNYRDDWNLHTDIPFSYTRGYFGVVGKDSPTKPFFISKPLNKFIYDYEKIGEVWNRYATFSNFALINIKDELPAWNYTYHRIILNATAEVVKGINAAATGFTTADNDVRSIQKAADGYLKEFRFFYFSTNFDLNGVTVSENNGYRKFNVSLSGKTVQESYHDGQFSVQGELTGSDASLRMGNYYDYMRISLQIKSGSIAPTFVSYSSINGGKPLKMGVEALSTSEMVDFGLVGDSSAVNNLAKYMHFSVGRALTQESLIKYFHRILKNIYLNDTPLNYKFGIFVRVIGPPEVTYIVWNDKSPTTDSYIIWLNNEIRPIVYKVGISEFPQHGYDLLTLDSVYYSVNNLWMDTDYESSSIFGYATQGKARASADGYLMTLSYSL